MDFILLITLCHQLWAFYRFQLVCNEIEKVSMIFKIKVNLEEFFLLILSRLVYEYLNMTDQIQDEEKVSKNNYEIKVEYP